MAPDRGPPRPWRQRVVTPGLALAARRAPDRRRPARHRPHRSRHLDRLGHPRLPWPAGGVDQEPDGRADGRRCPTTSTIPAVRRRSWQQRLASPAWAAEPNAGHRALVDLERQGRLAPWSPRTSTSCISGPATTPDLVIELHGTMRRVRVLGVRGRGADGSRARPGPGGRSRPHCVVRWHPEVGHHQLRPVAGPRDDAPGPRRRPSTATSSWPWVRAWASTRPPGWCRWPRTGRQVVIVNAQPTPSTTWPAVRGSISAEPARTWWR